MTMNKQVIFFPRWGKTAMLKTFTEIYNNKYVLMNKPSEPIKSKKMVIAKIIPYEGTSK